LLEEGVVLLCHHQHLQLRSNTLQTVATQPVGLARTVYAHRI
jgi:hypothetical protein